MIEAQGSPALDATAAELDEVQFDECEAIIDAGQKRFLEVGMALTMIRNLGLRELRRRGYDTFEQYVRRRWDWSYSRARQMIVAAEIVESLQEPGRSVQVLPTSEWQARPLAPLEPEARRAVWSEVIRVTPEGKPQVSSLRRLVRERVEEDRADRQEKQRAAEDAREQFRVANPQPEPDPLPGVRLEVADAAALPLEDCSVDLQITSPAYGLDVDYEGSTDAAVEWQDRMAAWLAEAFRVAKVGGRLALNVPLDTTRGGYRPTYAQAVQIAINAGWAYRASIVWNEGTVSKSHARGSVDSPAAPHVIAPVEMIAVFSRGVWKRQSSVPPDLTHDEWLEWTNGLWTFSGESHPWEGFPAAFPEELPRRLTKLLSFPRDVVLDQHGGSFTTALTAWKLGRQAVSFDLSPGYVLSGRRRIGAAQAAEPGGMEGSDGVH